MNAIQVLGKLSKASLISITLVLIATLGALDYLTSAEVSFALFYLIPIALAAWFTTRELGLAVAVLSALVWLSAHLLAEASRSHHLIHAWNTATSTGFFVIIAYLLSGLKRALERERELARTDYLTGAANLRHFYELVEMENQRSYRYGHPVTIAYIDVDNFKLVNDRFGHHTGDQLLQTITETLRRTVRAVDQVGRLGGDEFALLLPETGPEAAKVVMRKVHQYLLEEMQTKGWPVTFSIGVVTFAGMLTTADEIMQHADAGMYTTKHDGKNGITYQVLGERHVGA